MFQLGAFRNTILFLNQQDARMSSSDLSLVSSPLAASVVPQSPLDEADDDADDMPLLGPHAISDDDKIDVLSLLYKDGYTMAQRFGGMTGLTLLHAIFKRYQVNEDGESVEPNAQGVMEVAQLPWFERSADNAPLPFITRHPDNVRGMASNDAALDDSVGQQGVMWSMRGECWAIHVQRPPYLAISAGSLTASFYRVHAKSKGSAESQVMIDTLRAGLPCRLFHNRTPLEVRMFLKDYHNAFHAGCAHSFVEALSDIVFTIEPAWKVHMTKRQFTTRSHIDGLSYARYQATWMEKNFPNSFKHHSEFLIASSFVSWLLKLVPHRGFPWFKKMMGDLVDFQKIQAKGNKSVYTNMDAIRCFLQKKYGATLHNDILGALATEILKFTLPLWIVDDDGSQHANIKEFR